MLKNGSECLINNGQKIKYNLLDFWRWNSSDLLSNTIRGRFAEFIVASVTNVDLNQVRDEWGAYDLITPEGIKIEVKSSAYVQSWEQKSPSKISFGIKAALSWDEETNKRLDVAIRSADVYVFCLLHHNVKDTCDPLDLDHWEFYVIATEELNKYTRSKNSIGINALRKMADPIVYTELNKEITYKNQLNRLSQDR